MDRNSAKKAPILERLVDTSQEPAKASAASKLQSFSQLAAPAMTPANGASQTISSNTAFTRQTIETPKNRRIDKSNFELEITQIVNRVIHKHFRKASEEIVREVLREVRSRLPGQRKN